MFLSAVSCMDEPYSPQRAFYLKRKLIHFRLSSLYRLDKGELCFVSLMSCEEVGEFNLFSALAVFCVSPSTSSLFVVFVCGCLVVRQGKQVHRYPDRLYFSSDTTPKVIGWMGRQCQQSDTSGPLGHSLRSAVTQCNWQVVQIQ